MLDLAGDEIVDQGIEDDAVPHTLHPGGLAGADQLGGSGARFQLLDDYPGGGPLADGRIGSQHRHPQGADLFDLAGEEVQL